MVRCLTLAGADVNRRRVGGKTALEVSAGRGNVEVVSILIDAGATIDGIDGTKAFENAVEQDFIGVVKLLLAKGVSPNKPPIRCGQQQSALQQAVERLA
jgi:ankyrin repeat protein